jgi:hypothetical protein
MKPLAPVAVKRLAAACIAALVTHAAWAASGEFTFVTGEVTLTKANGTRSTPARGTPVDPGDRVTTGANGMAQLTMVDQARLSLRPSTQFLIEAYPDSRESQTGGVLNLLRGTLRTFTGLIASTNRDRFVMKTRVATVGIRGSGNILYACEDKDCDESVTGPGGAIGAVTVNHTIDGSHAVTSSGTTATGTLITGPGQTVLVSATQGPRYIPTPRFIADVATNMTGAKESASAPAQGSSAETRNFSPSDTPVVPAATTGAVTIAGSTGTGFPLIDATGNLESDPLALRDVMLSASSPLLGQSLPGDLVLDGNAVRSYRSYPAGVVNPTITGGTQADFGSMTIEGTTITWGRWANASLDFFGGGASTPVPGSIHWMNAPSGYPTYLAEVLTGTAAYTLVGGTNPTNQNNVVGSLGSATLNVNFSDRTLGFNAQVSMPAQGSAAGGTWSMTATNVPISLNSFYASTLDRLTIVNGSGVNSGGTNDLSGSFQGSFVGTGLAGAIMGYAITDTTAGNIANWHFVSGVAAFTGPRRDATAEYREGRINDVNGNLTQFIRSYATTNRPDEVTSDATGRATAFSAPSAQLGVHANYSIGTAQVVQQGFDPETGMVWGRWAGGVATATRGGTTEQLFLNDRSLHYIFAGTQSGPVALPLTGTGVYDVIGSTSPTDFAGHTGTLNSAALNVNFSNRTADATVNIGINGQTWNGTASGMAIYRDQYFGAYSGTPIPGQPNPAPLIISCQPSCGQGAAGSFDGFFTGRTGGRAGMMYNLGGNQGAVAFGRRGGGV